MIRLKTAFCAICVLCLTSLTGWADGQQMMSVQVKTSQIRSTPSFLGRVAVSVFYGDRVLVIGKKGAWTRVRLPARGTEGWMHDSALSSKKIVFRAGSQDVRQYATGDEVAMAGKGFNKDVEAAFKAKNPHTDFTWVNRMEAMTVAQSEMTRFLDEGGLSPRGGVQ